MNKTPSNIRAVVIGGSSITGGEVCRLLLGHPVVGTIIPTSRGDEPFERVHQNLQGSGISFHKIEDVIKSVPAPDVAFFCTPSGEAMKYAHSLMNAGTRVIDLSADFRFKFAGDYEHVYKQKHLAVDLLGQAVCGITELYREKIANAQLVANPGCYVIASILGLMPLLKSEIIDHDSRIHICAINGTTGAGANMKRDLHHAYAFGSMLPYNLNGHRHRAEIEKRIEETTSRHIDIDLTTIHGNFARGIVVLASIAVNPKVAETVNRKYLLNVYKTYYGSGDLRERFVIVNDQGSRVDDTHGKEYDIYPSLARVVGSNMCHIGVDYDHETHLIKIISVIDNLVKGAAGSAIQNMNVMLGIKEDEGLSAYGL